MEPRLGRRKREGEEMNVEIRLGASVSAMVLAICCAAPASAEEQGATASRSGEPAARAEADSSGLGDIVVTARRREESIQTAPVAVTALSGATLTQKNVVNLADLAGSTPSVSIRRQSNNPDSAIITIRGQQQNETNITVDPAVGVYIGDMYVARAYGVLGDLLDVQRVEVLRGPQGSLFGRNTIGGAIKITPVKPDVSGGFTGFLNAGVGNFSARSVSGAITIPVIEDKLAIRYAGAYRKRNGYTTGYLVAEPNLTPINSFDMNDYSRQTHRLSLAWRPTDGLRVDVSGFLYRSTSNGTLVANLSGDIATLNLTNFSSSFRNSPQRAADFYSALIPVTIRNGGVPSTKALTKYVQGTIEYDLTDEVTAKLALSYAKSRATTMNQNTSGIVTDSVALFQFTPTTFQSQNQRSAEFQLLGKSFDAKLNWILGAYYFKEKGFETNTGITKVFGDPGGSVTFNANSENSSKSMFGYAEFAITDALSINAGGRYTWDTKALQGRNRWSFATAGNVFLGLAPHLERSCIYSPGPNITTSATTDGPCLLDRTDKFHYFTYDVGINYKISSDIFFYAKANNGVRSGGQQARAVNFNSATAFFPDKVKNYEAGIKADLFDRKFRTNAAVFHVDYTNVQQQIILAPPVVPTTTTQVINNPGKAKVDGFEVESTARPIDALTLRGSVSYVKTKFPNPNRVQFYTPEWQYSLGATYDVALGDKNSLRLNADYSHVSSFYMSPNRADRKLPGYGTLSLRASYLIGEHLDLSLYATNVTDKKYYAAGIISGNLAPATVGEPRMYGAELTYRF